jgi:membrane protease YdiL (CAAX protease family)
MLRTLRPFFISLFCTSVALATAAIVYSKQHPHTSWIVSAALPAFICEAVFYLASIFKQTRELFRKLRAGRLQAILLWISALAPYLIFSLSAGTFDRNRFYLLATLTAVFSFWYAVLPRRAAYDAGFVILAAVPQITRVFTRLYISPNPHIPADILGHLMWIHVGVVALLVLREWKPGEFSLWPTPREWLIGIFVFLLGIAPLIGLAQAVHDVRFVAPHSLWWRLAGEGIGTFFGILWVVALSEELVFRGFIQRALENHWRNPAIAILVSAVLFGSAHLWLHAFPNWRHSIVASLLGIACGIAYWWSGSVRGSMVTHAFVVVTWRLFFAS